MNKTVILEGARTPFGKFGGGLKSLTASDLGGVAIHAALTRANVAVADVGEVIFGTVYRKSFSHRCCAC